MFPKGKKIPIFLALVALFWFSLYAYSPILTPYIKSFSAPKMASLIIASYGFTQMLLRIPVGILSDKLKNRKLFILLGLAFSAIGALGMALFQNQWAALIFRGFTGFTAATWVPFSILYSSYYDRDKATRAIGIANGFNFAGQLASQLIGGWLAESVGRTSTFYLALAAASAGIVLSFFIVDQDKSDFPEKSLKLTDYLGVAKDRLLILSSVLAIFSMFSAFATVYSYTSVFAEANAGATDTQLGLMLTLCTLPGVFAAPLSAGIAKKLGGVDRSALLTFIVNAAYCCTVPFIKTVWMFYAMNILYGFARGLATSLLMSSAIRNIDPSKRATAMGFFQAIYGIGMTLGPIVVGFFDNGSVGQSDVAGLTIGYFVVAAVQVAAAIITMTLFRRELDRVNAA